MVGGTLFSEVGNQPLHGVQISKRWDNWRPHGRPELEPKTLFMPQQLLTCMVGLPMNIANALSGYMDYHCWAGTKDELLIFLRTSLVDDLVFGHRAKDINWSVDPTVRFKEEEYLHWTILVTLVRAAMIHQECKIPASVRETAEKILALHRRQEYSSWDDLAFNFRTAFDVQAILAEM